MKMWGHIFASGGIQYVIIGEQTELIYFFKILVQNFKTKISKQAN